MSKETMPLRSAAPLWLRGPISLTPDKWLVLERAHAATYQPVTDTHTHVVLFDLANIHKPQDALRFAEQHGLLWHGPDAHDLREPFKDWWEEAHDVRKMLNLCMTWQQARTGGSTRELRSWFGRVHDLQDADMLARAAALITERVSQKLADYGVRLALNKESNSAMGIFSLGPASASPLHRAYWQLAQLLTNDVPLATCAEAFCSRFFEQTDPRQQYCSPTCANRARQRRWVERARSTRNDHADDTNG